MRYVCVLVCCLSASWWGCDRPRDDRKTDSTRTSRADLTEVMVDFGPPDLGAPDLTQHEEVYEERSMPALEFDGKSYAQHPVWPDSAPDLVPTQEAEKIVEVTKKVGGRTWWAIQDVSDPSYVVLPPKTEGNGATLVVFPGGGYQVLAIDLEGVEICDWATSIGMTCVILKYRVPYSGCHVDEKCKCWNSSEYTCKCHKTPEKFTALQDAQRTISTLRAQAKRWRIDPEKIGVIGFSAGGNLVAMASSRFDQREYEHVDAIDGVSPRPDFAIALYPGHMSTSHKRGFDGTHRLTPDVEFGADAPPTLLIHARDDRVNPLVFSTLYRDALREQGVPVELKVPAKGGHAFGLRSEYEETARWPEWAEAWLRARGVLDAKPSVPSEQPRETE